MGVLAFSQRHGESSTGVFVRRFTGRSALNSFNQNA
jgi:hypothetical protein